MNRRMSGLYVRVRLVQLRHGTTARRAAYAVWWHPIPRWYESFLCVLAAMFFLEMNVIQSLQEELCVDTLIDLIADLLTDLVPGIWRRLRRRRNTRTPR